MPKKACCCGGSNLNYIAIPCRAFSWFSQEASQVFNNSTTEYGLPPGYGPTRTVINQDGSAVSAFDPTRTIVYMMRGAGGGGNGQQQGGNGAYGEYLQPASLQTKYRHGRGGTAAQTSEVQNFTLPYGGGGQGYEIASFGGGASVLGLNSTNSSGSNLKLVAGGGGAGRSNNGGHGGTYNGITGFGLFGGGAASQSAHGRAGITTDPNYNTTPGGQFSRGGRGAFLFPPMKGYGGGGGGGYFAGGGGGATKGVNLSELSQGSGGGGGSSTMAANSRNFIEGKDSGPGAVCNPYLFPWAGVGGNRPDQGNNFKKGMNGQVSQYFINRYCACDGENSENIPDPLFLCLSPEQFQKIIDEVGDPPPECDNFTNINCLINFTLGGEKYVLLGNSGQFQFELFCDSICESNFKKEGSPTDIFWSIQGFGCCEIIRCFRYCSTTPVCDATCTATCDNPSYYCCDNTEDKPNVYFSQRNNFIYKCFKTSAWIPFGQTINQTLYVPYSDGGGWGSFGGGGFGGVPPSNLMEIDVNSYGIPGCLPVVWPGVIDPACDQGGGGFSISYENCYKLPEDAADVCAGPPKTCSTTIANVNFDLPTILSTFTVEYSYNCCEPQYLDTFEQGTYCGIACTIALRSTWVPNSFTFTANSGEYFGGFVAFEPVTIGDQETREVALTVTFECGLPSLDSYPSFSAIQLEVCGASVSVDSSLETGDGNFCNVFAAAIMGLLGPSASVTVTGSSTIHSSEVNEGPVANGNTLTWYRTRVGTLYYAPYGGIALCAGAAFYGPLLTPYELVTSGSTISLTNISNEILEFKVGKKECTSADFPPQLFYIEPVVCPQDCVVDCETVCTSNGASFTLSVTLV